MKWQAKTNLGKMVQEGHVKSFEELFNLKLPILEPEIVYHLAGDKLLTKIVSRRRVQKTTRSGKEASFSIVVAIGNGKNVFGLGNAKSKEVYDAVNKATRNAAKNLIYLSKHKDEYREMAENKVTTSTITISPSAKGSGIVANPLLKEICLLAGLTDVRVELRGSNNNMNYVKAFFNCLKTYTNESL